MQDWNIFNNLSTMQASEFEINGSAFQANLPLDLAKYTRNNR